MDIAIVGCGFVADLYARSFAAHKNLVLVGVMDQKAERAQLFASRHGVPAFETIARMLSEARPEVILNLTNPASHFEVSRQALLAGVHVYSEKPLATQLEEAKELVALAAARGLQIAAAPCNVLSESAAALAKALRERRIGDVHLVYAEMDDGLLHRMPYRQWRTPEGTPWPWKDEFEQGCTLEHAGYYLTWLVAFFGPARRLTSHASVCVEDKGTDSALERRAPDFSVATIEFASGVVARLTCSIVAPHDHSLTIVGERGTLSTRDCWNFRSAVFHRSYLTLRRRFMLSPLPRRIPLLRSGDRAKRFGAASMDFCRGVAEFCSAIEKGKRPALSAAFALHITEISLAISGSLSRPGSYDLASSVDVEDLPLGPVVPFAARSVRGTSGSECRTLAPVIPAAAADGITLVTGANGFLGRRFITIAHTNSRLRALVRKADAGMNSLGVEVVTADLAVDDLTAALAGVDRIIHFAADMRGPAADTLVPTERLFEAAVRAGVRRVLLISSFAVYDPNASSDACIGLEGVDCAQAPGRDDYARAKIGQELLARRYAGEHRWHLTILRPAAVFGIARMILPEIGHRVGPFMFVIAPLSRPSIVSAEDCCAAITSAACATVDPDTRTDVYDVVDDQILNRWNLARSLHRKKLLESFLIPVPFWMGLALARTASVFSRCCGARLRLPNILKAQAFRARFSSNRISTATTRAALGWRPRRPIEIAWHDATLKEAERSTVLSNG